MWGFTFSNGFSPLDALDLAKVPWHSSLRQSRRRSPTTTTTLRARTAYMTRRQESSFRLNDSIRPWRPAVPYTPPSRRPAAPPAGTSPSLSWSPRKRGESSARSSRTPVPTVSCSPRVAPTRLPSDEELLFIQHAVGVPGKPVPVSFSLPQRDEERQHGRAAYPEIVVVDHRSSVEFSSGNRSTSPPAK